MKINKICLNCGKIFNSDIIGNAQFCNDKCGRLFRRKNGISKRGNYYKTKCFVCNKEFYYAKHEKKLNFKYPCCSRKCVNNLSSILLKNKKLSNNLEDITCKQCGKKFSEVWYKFRKFCSKKCYDKFRLSKHITKKCLTCSKEFLAAPGKKRKYCNKICFLQRGITWISKECPNCNKVFKHPKGHPQVCCSSDCAYKYRSKKKK